MSDNDDRDSGKTGAFLLGFLFGVLVSLGAGGSFYFVQIRQMRMEAIMERDRAMAAEMVAREAAERAVAAARAAEAKATEAKEKDKK